MKEITYGWYPSVNNIYRPKNTPSSHHLQCLYNFNDYQSQIVYPESELFVRGVASTTPPITPQYGIQKSRSLPVPKFRQESKISIPTPIECWSRKQTLPETQWGVIDDRKPHLSNLPSEINRQISQDSKQQQQQQNYLQQMQLQQQQNYLQQKQLQQQLLKLNLQQQQDKYILERNQTAHHVSGHQKSSQESSACSVGGSILSWPVVQKAYPLRPQSSYSGQSSTYQQEKMVSKKKRPWSSPLKSPGQGHRDTKSSIIPTPSSERNTSTSQCPVRIRSATLYRDKVPQPTRPITAVTDQNSDQEQELIFCDEHHSELERSLTRPVTPVPFANDINETFCELEESIKLQTSPSPNEDDYEKIVDSYGWRAQIHGDPYQLKRPMKRESYVVNCTVAKPLPDPPVVYMETKEPFFYNTIPRKPLSFSVDREWMSEVLVAKRLDLQKRESGIKYNYKNFAFVY